MATYQELTVYELNDETLGLAVVGEDTGTAYDLASVTLEMLIKPTADTPDAEAVILSTTTGEITITDAADGLAEVRIDRTHLAEAGDLVWRLDLVVEGTRRTAVYGPLRVINL